MEQFMATLRGASALDSHAEALPRVVQTLETFLVDSRWTLESASKRGLTRLLDHLLKREWPGFSQKCRELRLQAGIEVAVRHGYDVRVLEWWLNRYMPDQKVISLDWIFELAIRHAQIPVLEWLYQETSGDLPHLEKAAECLDPNTIVWLYEHGRRHSSAQLDLQYENWQESHFKSIQQCLIYQEEQDDAFMVLNTETVILDAIRNGRLQHLQWLFEHRPELFERAYMGDCVSYGRLDVAKWLYQQFPKHYFEDAQLRCCFVHSSQFDLETIRWVLCKFEWEHDRNRLFWMTDAAKLCAGIGSLEMAKFMFQTRVDQLISAQDTSNGSTKAVNELVLTRVILEEAAANGHLAIIKWAYSQSSQVIVPTAMDRAAANAHIGIVRWLHQNRSDGCTTGAMDSAASNGHLEMVQWLHENRSEGCTTMAMDVAAIQGHMDVVKWLHKNRSEGCTTTAMDNAAANGYLAIVKLLHENRNEGCTAGAMDYAAGRGHLNVVRFLHENRQEGCTDGALFLAGIGEHVETFKWLYENRAESLNGLNGRFVRNCIPVPSYLKCLALYTAHDRLGWFVDKFVQMGDFETVELLLSTARANGVTLLDCEYVATL